MDRGAARSRKRSGKVDRPIASATRPNPAGPSRSNSTSQDRPKKALPGQHRQPHIRAPREAQSKDPSLYVAKAVRTAAALNYAQEPFPIPPSKEVLTNVRRVDLSGSGVTDISWLQGTGVTWLSLADCPIEVGWEAVGSLTDLAVLNISRCGLKVLPKSLGSLNKLKAVVAMGNEWTDLDSDVMSNWTELNSLIISHSTKLVSVPRALSKLYQLSKLTFSHCPRLTCQSLPDLSSLPLLRDVKMNNLPQLTSLPSHIVSWGTGDMSLANNKSGNSTEVGSSSSLSSRKVGDGLEVLDLGNCSLTFDAASKIFGLAPKLHTKNKNKDAWSHLRSLSLHSNPLATTHPDYTDLLQASSDLPNLQIIDTKRVRERKRKGQVQESKEERKAREKRQRKMQPTGANAGGGKMRSWGAEAGEDNNDQDVPVDDGAHTQIIVEGKNKRKHDDKYISTTKEQQEQIPGHDQNQNRPSKRPKSDSTTTTFNKSDKQSKSQRKLKHRQASPNQETAPVLIIRPDKYHKTPLTNPNSKTNPNSNTKTKHSDIAPATRTTQHVDPTITPTAAVADPSTLVKSSTKGGSGRNETAVLRVIEVAKPVETTDKKNKKDRKDKDKGKEAQGGGGVDLKAVFGKNKVENDMGLGVGGW
ncbi:hypothetical protein BCR39DRAFT_531650 [Naematelia encephala]|uniref:L domain-like protein n=1 Tax=Naematelia encephala TaxID=71784 RepID=A0A1Y2B4D3_9TREE|nr:hypothetical protein BCR39DRAFT_531650 [Naematelia encephala]